MVLCIVLVLMSDLAFNKEENLDVLLRLKNRQVFSLIVTQSVIYYSLEIPRENKSHCKGIIWAGLLEILLFHVPPSSCLIKKPEKTFYFQREW